MPVHLWMRCRTWLGRRMLRTIPQLLRLGNWLYRTGNRLIGRSAEPSLPMDAYWTREGR